MSADEWMISVDDHLIEPRHVWTDRLPAKFRDVGPRWMTDDEGEAWRYEDIRQPIGGAMISGAIWPVENRLPAYNPLAFSEIPPACYDPKARVERMDEDHVLASLVFPNFPGFAGSLFLRRKDKELALLCVQAYNDWMLDEWCASAPGRFIGMALLPLWDGRLAALEAERAISKGARAISFSMIPQALGLPAIYDPDGFWDPLFSVLNDANVPLCAHLGTGSGMAVRLVDGGAMKLSEIIGVDGDLMARRIGGTMMQFDGQETLVDWLYSGKFERYPNLKVCLSENGIAWIPAVLQVADRLTNMKRNRATHPSDPENEPLLSAEDRRAAQLAIEARAFLAADAPLPSELFRDHVYGCFIEDPLGLKFLDEIGVDNVMIETDFPHLSTSYPLSMEKAQACLSGRADEVRWKVLRGNAQRVFNFTPAGVAGHAGVTSA
jgi:predicted TIM-barrel fold metal-dependent hydrolase